MSARHTVPILQARSNNHYLWSSVTNLSPLMSSCHRRFYHDTFRVGVDTRLRFGCDVFGVPVLGTTLVREGAGCDIYIYTVTSDILLPSYCPALRPRRSPFPSLVMPACPSRNSCTLASSSWVMKCASSMSICNALVWSRCRLHRGLVEGILHLRISGQVYSVAAPVLGIRRSSSTFSRFSIVTI